MLWLIKGLGVGGAERLLVSSAQARDRESFDYEVAYLLPWKDAFVADLEAQGLQVHCLHGDKEWDLGWARRLRRRLAERPVDILHVHSPYVAGIARLLVRTLPPGVRPALVGTEHIPWEGCSRPTRVLNSLTFPLDDAHLAVSNVVLESIPRRHRRRVETVVHGVVLASIREQLGSRTEVRVELGAAPGEVLVGTVANFRPQKAYPDLLAAAALVRDSGAPVRFVVVGQGPLEYEVRRLRADLGLDGSILLLGQRDDAMRVMAGCDVFVLASHYEGYPVAVMEALALGLPVVATRVGGVPEAVRDGVEGLLVPPGRPDVLAKSVVRLADDPELRAGMARNALVRGDRFDISGAVRRIEDIYRAVAGKPGR